MEQLELFSLETPKKLTVIPEKVSGQFVYIKNEYREDFVQFLRDWPDRQYNGKHNLIKVTSWNDFVKQASQLPAVQFNISPEIQEEIDSYIEPNEVTVNLDENKENLLVHVKFGGRSWIVREILYAKHIKSSLPGSVFEIPVAFSWLLIRRLNSYEVKTTWDEEALAICIKQLEERKKLDELINSNEIEDIIFNGYTLRKFQVIGAKFVLMNECRSLIGDDMGLGKTPQALYAIEEYRKQGKIKKTLIVCPAQLRMNIVREVHKFANETPYIIYGETPQRNHVEEWIKGNHAYYVASYDTIGARIRNPDVTSPEYHIYPWVEVLNILPPDCILADEIHYIKNVDSARSQAMRKLESTYRIGLSGTIMPNRPKELWAPIKWCRPDMVDSYAGFQYRYQYNDGTPREVEELKELIKPFYIRRKKSEVIKELDPINRIVREHELSISAKNAYNLVITKGLRPALAQYDPSQPSTIQNVLTQLLTLKQICAFDKIEHVADLAVECYDNNTTNWRKVIILSQFTERPPMIHEISRRLGHEVISFDGSVSHKDREVLVDRFMNDDNIKFCVATIQTAQEGLNKLVAAGTIIFTDLTWTPKDHIQAEGRAYGRLNDLHSIDSIYMVASNTIEDTHIMPILERKIRANEAVIEGSQERETSVVSDLIRSLKEENFDLV